MERKGVGLSGNGVVNEGGVGTHLTGGSKNGSTFAEEIIISCLQLNGLDEHGVASVLVGPQHCSREEGRERGGGERERERERETPQCVSMSVLCLCMCVHV